MSTSVPQSSDEPSALPHRGRSAVARAPRWPPAAATASRQRHLRRSRSSQADIDKAMQTPTELTFWTWVPDIAEGGRALREEVPGDQGQGGQRRSGRAAVHQAAHGAEGRQRRPGRGADRVPVHPDLHPHQQPAGPAAVRRGGAEGHSSSTGPGARSAARTARSGRSRRTPARWACCTGKDIFDKHGIDVAEDLGRVRRRGPQAARGRPERLPDEPGREPERRLDGPAVAGRRQAVRRRPAGATITVNVNDDDVQEARRRTGAGWPRRASSPPSRTSPTPGTRRSTRASTPPGSPRPGARCSSPARAKATAGKWRAAPLPQWDAGQAESGQLGRLDDAR